MAKRRDKRERRRSGLGGVISSKLHKEMDEIFQAVDAGRCLTALKKYTKVLADGYTNLGESRSTPDWEKEKKELDFDVYLTEVHFDSCLDRSKLGLSGAPKRRSRKSRR